MTDVESQARQIYDLRLIERLLPKLQLFPGAVERPPRGRISRMEELIGKMVTAVWISPDAERLVFETDDGNVAYRTYGDCCSYSYFNDIIGLDALIGQKVNSAEEIGLGDVETDDSYDCIRAYGIKLTTNRGYVDVVFRNESNGYYGGWCETDYRDDVPEDMVKITAADWSRDD
jgi:hypothetical protein